MEQIIGLIIPMSFLGVFYFFIIKPQKKRQNKLISMRESLKIGDKIVTIGGICGTIIAIDNNDVTIEISQGVNIGIEKWAIGKIKEEKESI